MRHIRSTVAVKLGENADVQKQPYCIATCMNAVVGGVSKHFPRTFYRGASIRFPIDRGQQCVACGIFVFTSLPYEYHITAFGRGYNLVEIRSAE